MPSSFLKTSLAALALFAGPLPAIAADAPKSAAANVPGSIIVEGHGGVPLVVQEWGNPDGPPILLIHGFSFSAVSWKNQIGEIADNARIIAFDLRGHGLSGKPWDATDYTASQIWADDVAAVLAAKHVERPVIVGWSYGGYVAMDYLRHCGMDCASGLVLVGSLGGMVAPAPPPDPQDFGMPASQGDVRADNFHALFLGIAWTARVMTYDPPAPLALLQKQLSMAMTPPYVRRAMSSRTLDNRDLAECLDLPVLVIRGEQDGTVGEAQLAEFLTHAPATQTLSYAGVGHSPFEERPDLFNRDLLEFVRQTEGRIGE